MFAAYFDETEAATVFLVAGWVAMTDEWARFTGAWNAALAAPPAISYLSHHEAKAQKGQFLGWSTADIDAKLAALAAVICAHEMYGVTGGVRTTTWKSAFDSEVLTRKQLTSVLKLTHPYQACFHGSVAAVLQLQQEKGHTEDPVDFTFDEQTGLLKGSIKHYEEFKRAFPPDLKKIAGTIAIGDDKELAPLQAADLLCGLIGSTLSGGSPSTLYKALLACHPVAQFTSYPPNFQSVPSVVEALDRVWSEKQILDSFLALVDEAESKKT